MENVKGKILSGELHLVHLLNKSVIVCTNYSYEAVRLKVTAYGVLEKFDNAPNLEISGYDDEGMNRTFKLNELKGIIL